MIGILGEIRFKVSHDKILTFSDMNINSSGRWAEHGTKERPQLEFTGDGLDTISFNLKVSAHHGVNLEWVSYRLQSYKAKGTKLQFILNNKPFRNRKWVVTSFNENWIRVDNKGKPLTSVFSVELKEVEVSINWYKDPISIVSIDGVKEVTEFFTEIDYETGEMS